MIYFTCDFLIYVIFWRDRKSNKYCFSFQQQDMQRYAKHGVFAKTMFYETFIKLFVKLNIHKTVS